MTETSFVLHAQLAKDCRVLGCFSLSMLLLMNDSHYPWLILVPKRHGITEVHNLNQCDQQQLMRESCALSQMMETVFSPDKINIATLGNIVPQLHIHHIARFVDDAAWPAPVWGKFTSIPYKQQALDEMCMRVVQNLMRKPVESFDISQ